MAHELLEVLARGMQSIDDRDGRIYGVQSGIVTEVDKNLNRIKARIGAQGDNESSDWLDAGLPGSIEALPEIKEPVFVAFVDGDPHRGVYWWHPNSTTKNRAQDFMTLGTTLVGMLNFFVTQFNQLRTDFNNHTHQVPGTGTTCVNGSAWTGTATAQTPTATTAVAANKGKASDGSVVPDKAGSNIVLTGRVKIK